jgi:hypothetical protein
MLAFLHPMNNIAKEQYRQRNLKHLDITWVYGLVGAAWTSGNVYFLLYLGTLLSAFFVTDF